MKFSTIIVCLGILITSACKPEPTGPESNCHLLPSYQLDYGFLKASRVFDVRTTPPTEIVNGIIEYDLSNQWFLNYDEDPVPYPYSEYFLDSFVFVNQSMVNVFGKTLARTYEYVRNDCQVELESPEGKLHLELTQNGDEISETRFSIYDHSRKRVTIDTFSFLSDTFTFIEFRYGHFLSYEDIVKQFALDNPGQYDTIGIEQVENRTREY